MAKAPDQIVVMVPLWGERYIQDFLDISLPFFLSSGNAPALAALAPTRLCFLTTASSASHLLEVYHRFCVDNDHVGSPQADVVLIDDLISEMAYGVTLTLAYARAIRRTGSAQTQTAFILLNSDFVLANGSLETIVGNIREGARTQYVPSLRVSASKVRDHLKEFSSGGSRRIPSCRALTKICLDNLHPTVLSKVVNQYAYHYQRPNIFYWRVDRDTMLARHYLAHILCIWPEKPLRDVNSYQDYGFVAAMTPNGPSLVVKDSEAICLLELQEDSHESEHILAGPLPTADQGRALSSWTTTEHRFIAKHEVVFHAGDLPSGLAAESRAFADYMSKVTVRLRRNPKDPRLHHYWTGGLAVSGLDLQGIEREFGSSRTFVQKVMSHLDLKQVVASFKQFLYTRLNLHRSFSASALSLLWPYGRERNLVLDTLNSLTEPFVLVVEKSDDKVTWIQELLKVSGRVCAPSEICRPPIAEKSGDIHPARVNEHHVFDVGPAGESLTDVMLSHELAQGAEKHSDNPPAPRDGVLVETTSEPHSSPKRPGTLVLLTDRSRNVDIFALSQELLGEQRFSNFILISVCGGYWMTGDEHRDELGQQLVEADRLHNALQSKAFTGVGSRLRRRLNRILWRFQMRSARGGWPAFVTAVGFGVLVWPTIFVNRWRKSSPQMNYDASVHCFVAME